MSLSSELDLDTSPRSAAQARRWVGEILDELARADLVECAELGVSELVANAVLHGHAPISVRVRGTVAHPRIEVHDGSTEPPVPPQAPTDPEDFLTTYGRGLAIVARAADAYGSTIQSDGKFVWFEPSNDMHEGDIDWVIDRDVPRAPAPVLSSDDAVTVILCGFDLQLYAELSKQYLELRRELRLLSLGRQETYPLAGNLSSMFESFERQFPEDYGRQIGAAWIRRQPTADITFKMLPASRDILITMSEMFDLADAFCRAERLLAVERSPLQHAYHSWILTELIGQLAGAQPTPWVHPDERAAQEAAKKTDSGGENSFRVS